MHLPQPNDEKSADRATGEFLVDTHAHIYRADLPVAPDALYVPTEHFELPQYLDVLDRHGVRNGVIAAPSFLGVNNHYTIASLRGSERVRATVMVEPDIDAGELATLRDAGVVGVRLSLRGHSTLPDFAASNYGTLFRRLADMDWHVHVHAEGPQLPPVLAAIMTSPVKVVIDHFGRPDPRKGESCEGFQEMLRAIESDRLWVRLSGGYRLGCDPMPLARKLMAVAGPKRLLWGSDCPFAGYEDRMTYQSAMDSLREWVPRLSDRITMARQAARLYHFESLP